MASILGYTKAKIDTLLALLAPLASPTFTGDPKSVTASVGDSDVTIATTAFVQGEKNVVLNTPTINVVYTLALSDNHKVIEMGSASALAMNVPLNSVVAFPIGTEIAITQSGAGKITMTPAGGVAIAAPGGLLGTRVQWSTIRLRKRGTDNWILSGDVG